MNKWWKAGLLGAGGLGLMALTGGTAAPLLGALGGEGVAAGAGAAGAAEAGALGAGSAGAGMLGGDAAATGALAYTTPSVIPSALGSSLAGSLAGTSAEYGTPAMLAEASSNAAAAPAPSMLSQMGGYAGQAGKAASTYSAVNGAMGGNAPPQQAPMARPVFQGAQAPITPQGPAGPMMGAQDTPFMRLLMDQRMRQRGGQSGMLG
jgi:hypothetical protein